MCSLVNRFVHNQTCSSLYLNEFLAIYYSNWFFKFQQYFCRWTFREGASEDKNTLYNSKVEILYTLNNETQSLILWALFWLRIMTLLSNVYFCQVHCKIMENGAYMWLGIWTVITNQGIVTRGSAGFHTHSIWQTFISGNIPTGMVKIKCIFYHTSNSVDNVSPMLNLQSCILNNSIMVKVHLQVLEWSYT